MKTENGEITISLESKYNLKKPYFELSNLSKVATHLNSSHVLSMIVTLSCLAQNAAK